MPSLATTTNSSSLSSRWNQFTQRQQLYIISSSLILFIYIVLSLSAHHHAQTSPSALKASHYLPTLSTTTHDDLSYRQYLEQTTSPLSFTNHSTTLTFSNIYVLSLPSRRDRREEMEKLARALGIEIEFVDAFDKSEPFFGWIAERVKESRQMRKKILAKGRNVAESTIGGINLAGDWLTPFIDSSSTIPFPPYPPPTSNRALQRQLSSTKSLNWIEHLETLHSQNRLAELKPLTSKSPVNVTKLLWDPLERVKVRQVSRGVLSTYFGQTRVMKRMLERGDETALVLEDDVDLEWDLERLWSTIERKLPTGAGEEGGWDITYLGHCWGGEAQKPQYLHPLLHPSTAPMCLHAYALTSLGASKILSHLLNPWTAYSTAVDLALPSLIHYEMINSFSIYPPLVVQRKDGPSDLQRGNGSKWRGLLRDSTHERVMRDEGRWNDRDWDDKFDPDDLDPATVLRCGGG